MRSAVLARSSVAIAIIKIVHAHGKSSRSGCTIREIREKKLNANVTIRVRNIAATRSPERRKWRLQAALPAVLDFNSLEARGSSTNLFLQRRERSAFFWARYIAHNGPRISSPLSLVRRR